VKDAIDRLNAAINGARAGATTPAASTAPVVGPSPAVVGPGGATAAASAEFRRQYNLLGRPYFQDVTDPGEISRYRTIENYVRANYDATSTESVRQIAAAAAQYGVSQADIATALGVDPETVRNAFAEAGIPMFAAGGYHVGGLRIVGERGAEMEATGASRIWTGDQLRDLLAGGAMAQELQALVAEVRSLREANSAENRSLARHAAKTATTLERVVPDGDALAVRTAV
jgi:transposase-like protein